MTETEIILAIAALERAYAMGEDTIEIGDKRIKYKTGDDVLKAIGYFKSQLVVTVSGSSSPTRSYAAFNRDV